MSSNSANESINKDSPSLNGSFETDFKLESTEAPAQLGPIPVGLPNRCVITRDRIGSTSFRATTQHVQYGKYDDELACLVVLEFAFRFKPRVLSRYSSAYVRVTFRCAGDVKDSTIKANPEEDPLVKGFGPRRVYGFVSNSDNKLVRELKVPFAFEGGGVHVGLETSFTTEQTAQQAHRMKILGQTYDDDEHFDKGPNGVEWDLLENEVEKEGIFRNFRGAIVVLNPRQRPMWMEVQVKPSVRFSVNPLRLPMPEPFRRLLQLNDMPVLLDGKTNLASQVELGCNDFNSKEFPWSKILQMPVEYEVSFLLPIA